MAPLSPILTSLANPTPPTKRFSFNKDAKARKMKEMNKLRCIVVLGQRSLLKQKKDKQL